MAFLDRVLAFLDRVRALFGALDREGALRRALVLAHDRDLNLDLASALQIARTLANVLDLDRARVLDQARDLAGGLVRDLSSALGSDYPLHRRQALDRAAVTARDLAHALDRARGSVVDGVDAPGHAAAPEPDLSRDLASALASYHELLRKLANYPVVDRDRDLVNDFARYRDLARYLDHRLAIPAEGDNEDSWSLPGRVQLAVWLLPRSWQPRYSEEFRAELTRLSRGERNKYARRVLKQAWRMRRELKWTECPPERARAEG